VPIPSSNPETQDSLANNPPGFIKDVYLSFFQEYFAKAPAGQFRFTGNDKSESELFITDSFGVDKEVIEHRPALVTLRGPISWANIGLDQLKDMNILTGRELRTDLVSGSMTIHCISRQGLEAERLSWQVMFALKSMRRVLQKKGLFEVGRDAVMGAETPPGMLVAGDVDPHTIDVPISSPFFVQITWSTEPAESHSIGEIEIRPKLMHVGPPGTTYISAESQESLGAATKAQLGTLRRRSGSKQVYSFSTFADTIKVSEGS
jgi:hypothetical protein